MNEQLKKLQKGDIKAFEELFRQFYTPLYYYAYRFLGRKVLAEEVVQDVFTQLWEKRKDLQLRLNIESYLYAAVKNRSLNVLKSLYHQTTSPLEVQDDAVAIPESSDQANDQADLLALVDQAIQSLPEKCRIIFLLSKRDGLTYQEISEELGVSRETVKSQIKIAFQKIRAFLGDRWEVLIWVFFIF